MASVKHKENGQWVKIGETPISTPIEITIYDGIPLPDSIVAGDEVVLYVPSAFVCSSTSMVSTGISITVKKAGTYRFKWWVDASGEDCSSQLYINGSAFGSSHRTSDKVDNLSEVVECSAGDTITLYFKGSYDSWEGEYYGGCGGFCACIDWPGLRRVIYGS